MGGYNSKEFSKEFSKRTEKNLKYIYDTVCEREEENNPRDCFARVCKSIIYEIDTVISDLREETNSATKIPKKSRIEVKRKIYSLVDKLDTKKKSLERSINGFTSDKSFPDDHLYEVTQLLNSLLGIAVLPYEMHKEFFSSKIKEDDRSEENFGKSLRDIQDSVKHSVEYDELYKHIMTLYQDRKWVTTYKSDLYKGQIDKDRVVFRFLYHLRNAACHSGHNGLSILPLDDGHVIDEILFYDQNSNDENDKFAMRLSVEEVEKLLDKVALFYRNSHIGQIDKTQKIKEIEIKVDHLLKSKSYNELSSKA